MKYEIAKAYFRNTTDTYELVQYSIDTPEIQDTSVKEIARQSAVWAAKEIGEPCIKMDVGFFIPTLNGFPGPFVKYINDWLTQADFLKLMEGKVDRSAYFEDAIAVGYPDGSSKVFSTQVHGSIAYTEDPSDPRWPANSLFIPEGYDRALGSLSNEEQNKFWGDGNWPMLIEYLERIAHDKSTVQSVQ